MGQSQSTPHCSTSLQLHRNDIKSHVLKLILHLRYEPEEGSKPLTTTEMKRLITRYLPQRFSKNYQLGIDIDSVFGQGDEQRNGRTVTTLNVPPARLAITAGDIRQITVNDLDITVHVHARFEALRAADFPKYRKSDGARVVKRVSGKQHQYKVNVLDSYALHKLLDIFMGSVRHHWSSEGLLTQVTQYDGDILPKQEYFTMKELMQKKETRRHKTTRKQRTE